MSPNSQIEQQNPLQRLSGMSSEFSQRQIQSSNPVTRSTPAISRLNRRRDFSFS